MITTQAWVLHRGSSQNGSTVPDGLSLESYSFDDLADGEVLVEPLYGCWEANMAHALERDPVDICRQRKEDRIVLGNSGVVRVLRCGDAVTRVREGDICIFICFGEVDSDGYVKLVHGYDAPGTTGLLAKQTKISEHYLAPVPENSDHTLEQWAAYARYWTAWSNWNVAYACWSSQMDRDDLPRPHVWGWGGGVSLAQLILAKRAGCNVAMTASTDARLQQIKDNGITAIDRRDFPDLHLDQERHDSDAEYRRRYRRSERSFLNRVREETDGRGVSIFIDNIGGPVYRATLRALGRQGVVTTAGWKHGMKLETMRANECIDRHIHVHTHAIRYSEIPDVMTYQNETNWLPVIDEDVYSWEDIPTLAQDYAENKLETYFPIFSVNDV